MLDEIYLDSDSDFEPKENVAGDKDWAESSSDSESSETEVNQPVLSTSRGGRGESLHTCVFTYRYMFIKVYKHTAQKLLSILLPKFARIKNN